MVDFKEFDKEELIKVVKNIGENYKRIAESFNSFAEVISNDAFSSTSVLVIVENRLEEKKMFKLFELLLKGQLKNAVRNRDYTKLESDNFNIRIFIKSGNGDNLRGLKANYVLNLTQDTEFDGNMARFMEIN
ncbi:hypothetical protein [Paenibacillus polymyxa]|uniref:hypothetical protein n=1 Tax=Paenibacillus polymyxa TaxID=1406 RepID=UPI002AB4F9DB|nr:hypothetical protein [Paenibacillus polymyxa]MDY8023357.1 hypothetical protein [Paenibacillus polymyxa]